jgi:hypothetical protein
MGDHNVTSSSTPHGFLISLGLAGLGVAAQALPEVGLSEPLEKLGQTGILVAGGYFMLRYFMSKVSEKDELIRKMNEEMQASHKENTNALIAHVREGYAQQERNTNAQTTNTAAVQQLTAAVQQLTRKP